MGFVIDYRAYFHYKRNKRMRGESGGERKEEKKKTVRKRRRKSRINIIINTHLEAASLCHQFNATFVT